LMLDAGADGLAFDPIVAFGESAAEPHHEPGHRVLEEGDAIKLDIGALVDGYHTDMTRTIACGQPTAELQTVHDIARHAQQAAIDVVRAGLTAVAVDGPARSARTEA